MQTNLLKGSARFCFSFTFNVVLIDVKNQCYIYRLTHSLLVNYRRPRAVLKNFEFIVTELVQVNPDNSRAMSALTFLLFKLNTLQAKIVKF